MLTTYGPRELTSRATPVPYGRAGSGVGCDPKTLMPQMCKEATFAFSILTDVPATPVSASHSNLYHPPPVPMELGNVPHNVAPT